MNMFKTIEEILDELYEGDYCYTIDQIIDVLEELGIKYQNEISDEYEYGNVYGDKHNIAYNDVLADEYERAQENFEKSVDEYDSVNHPAHYMGNIEVIDFIEDKHLNYNLGNCVKYISRAGKKREVGMSIQEKTLNDLQKARWYLDREISTLEKNI